MLILDQGNLGHDLAEEVRARESVEVIEAPRLGLVLATVREGARRSLFHLGEVLVSRAMVRVAGGLGVGLVRGVAFETAHDLAVVDAAYAAGLGLTEAWEPRLVTAEGALEAALDAEQAALGVTRVEFETLDQGAP